MTILVTKPTGTFIHIPKNAGVAISQWLTIMSMEHIFTSKQHGGKHAGKKN
jgi:hypothetical protein